MSRGSSSGEDGEMTIREMLQAHPQPLTGDREVVVRCIEACGDCATVCTSCADADLAESELADLVRCVRLCLDCADMCESSRRIVIRQTASDPGVVRAAVEGCLVACSTCRKECERHSEHHEHCRICAEVCSRCEQACADLLVGRG